MDRNKNKRGAAMLIVLCTFALIIALGTAALVAANATYTTAAQSIVQRQAYYTAVSYAEVLRSEICDSDSDICAQVSQIENGDEWDIAGTTEIEGMGTASGSLIRNGSTLTATVTGAYQDVEYTISARYTLLNGAWAFDTFLPVQQGTGE